MAIPIDLNKVSIVLHAILCGTLTCVSDHITPWEKLIGKSMQVFPQIYFTAVHIDNQGTKFFCLKNRVPVKTFFRVINRCPCGINCWICHKKLLKTLKISEICLLSPSVLTISIARIGGTVSLTPSFKKVVLYIKIVEHFPNGLIDKVLNGLWLMIEGGYRRQNVGAHVSGHGHESEMPLM